MKSDIANLPVRSPKFWGRLLDQQDPTTLDAVRLEVGRIVFLADTSREATLFLQQITNLAANAVETGNLEAARAILTTTIDPLAIVCKAAQHRYRELVDELLPRLESSDVSIVLWFAASGGDQHIVQACLAAGADAKAQHSAALRHAVASGHANVAVALLNAGADISVLDLEYSSPTSRFETRPAYLAVKIWAKNHRGGGRPITSSFRTQRTERDPSG